MGVGRRLIPREGRLTGARVSWRYLVQEIDPTYTRVTTVDSLDGGDAIGRDYQVFLLIGLRETHGHSEQGFCN